MPGGRRCNLFLLGYFLFIFAFSMPVFPGVNSKQDELNQVLEKIENTSKESKLFRKKKDQLIEKLAVIEKKFGIIARDLKKIQVKRHKKQQQIRKLSDRIIKQNLLIKKTTRQLHAQIRSAYVMGRTGKLKLFLNQQDPARLNRILVYYGYLNQDRMEKLKLTRDALQDLTYLEDEQKKGVEKLRQLAEQKRMEQAKLKSVKKERTVLLAKLNKEQETRQQKLGLLKRRESELRTLIQSLQKQEHFNDSIVSASDKPFALQKGNLIWPVQGKLSRKFGSSRGAGKWNGVLIEASEGSDVRSIANGRVVYADWLKGYGLLVIIDHGKGYMTLYAFNQSLYKKVDERVRQGDVVASVGKSGGRNRAGLYFAIRKKGKPLNPVRWCRKIHKGKVS